MIKQIKFFQLESSELIKDFSLGDPIELLVSRSIIKKLKDRDDVIYQSITDDRIRITESSDKVKTIHIQGDLVCEVLNININSFSYPQTDSITQFLASKHKMLENIHSMADLRSLESGNYFVVVFSDCIPNHLFLTRNN